MGGLPVSADVVKFYPKDAAKKADAVLEQAIGQYEDVLILGYDAEGRLDPRATLTLKKADILWLIENFKHRLLSGEWDE